MPENTKNPRHLIRAIESAGLKSHDKVLMKGAVIVGLDLPKEQLDERIKARVESMIAAGFIEEVRQLINTNGYPPAGWDAIGYKVVLALLESGELDENYIKQAIVSAHRHYAKRQRTWFRRNKNIHWFQSEEAVEQYLGSLFAPSNK